MKGRVARSVRCLDEIGERRLLFRGALEQEEHPSGGRESSTVPGQFGIVPAWPGIFRRGGRSLDERVRVAVENYARGVLHCALKRGAATEAVAEEAELRGAANAATTASSMQPTT